jgi:hypothetical protein
MRYLNALLRVRTPLVAAGLLLGGVSGLRAQQPTLDWLKQAFSDAGFKAKVRSDGLLEVRTKDKSVTVYVDVHPLTEQIHYFANLGFNPLAPSWQRVAALKTLNDSTAPLMWEEMSDGSVQVSGFLTYGQGLSSFMLSRAYAEFVLRIIVALAEHNRSGVIIA